GRLDGDKVDQLLGAWMDPTLIDYAFVCGPQDMTESVIEALQGKGLDKSRIKFELFGSPKGPRALRTGQEARKAPGAELCELTVVQDGLTRTLTIEKNKDSVLDSALAQGIELPYSCKGGVCSTCRCKVTEGEVDMDANFALEDYEVARGFVLSCQSFPVTDTLVIDFDQETCSNFAGRAERIGPSVINFKAVADCCRPYNGSALWPPIFSKFTRRFSSKLLPRQRRATTGAHIPSLPAHGSMAKQRTRRAVRHSRPITARIFRCSWTAPPVSLARRSRPSVSSWASAIPRFLPPR